MLILIIIFSIVGITSIIASVTSLGTSSLEYPTIILKEIRNKDGEQTKKY